MRILIAAILSLPLMAQRICINVPETLHYSVEFGGKKIGRSVIIIDTATFEGETVYKLQSLTDVVKQGRNVRDSVLLYFRGDWTPLYLERYMKGMDLSMVVRYRNGKADVRLKLGENEKSFTLSYPRGAIDNEEVLPFIRCLDAEKTGSGEIMDVTPLGGQVVKIKWEFKGIEKIGDKQVKRVLLKMPMKKVELFIKDRKIVKYVDRLSKIEMILEE